MENTEPDTDASFIVNGYSDTFSRISRAQTFRTDASTTLQQAEMLSTAPAQRTLSPGIMRASSAVSSSGSAWGGTTLETPGKVRCCALCRKD